MNKSEALQMVLSELKGKYITKQTIYHNYSFLIQGSIVEVVDYKRFFKTSKVTKCGFPVKSTYLRRIYDGDVALNKVKCLYNVINHSKMFAVLFTIYGHEHLITFTESSKVITLPKTIHSALMFDMIWEG